jgi:hypothetical protein
MSQAVSHRLSIAAARVRNRGKDKRGFCGGQIGHQQMFSKYFVVLCHNFIPPVASKSSLQSVIKDW